MKRKLLRFLGIITLLSGILFPSFTTAKAVSNNGFMRKAHITTISGYDTPTPGYQRGNGVLPHFVVDDNIGKAYCYNWHLKAPDRPGQEYNQYQFWDGMGEAAGPKKASQVAAALMQGYHLNQDTHQWEVGNSFKPLAQQGFKEMKKSFPFPLSPSYSLADYEQDVTQAVIWKLDGSPSSEGYNDALLDTALGSALYKYALSHPLDQETSEAKNITIKSNGKPVNDSNPLVINSKTLKSQNFTVSGYNGAIAIGNSNSNIEVIDCKTGKPVNRIISGQTYCLHAKSKGNGAQLTLDCEKVSDSHYFSIEDLNTGANKNNPYQNLVNLATKTVKLPVKYVFENQVTSTSTSTTSTTTKPADTTSTSTTSTTTKPAGTTSTSTTSTTTKPADTTSTSTTSTTTKPADTTSTSTTSTTTKPADTTSTSTTSTTTKPADTTSTSTTSTTTKPADTTDTSTTSTTTKPAGTTSTSTTSTTTKPAGTTSTSTTSTTTKPAGTTDTSTTKPTGTTGTSTTPTTTSKSKGNVVPPVKPDDKGDHSNKGPKGPKGDQGNQGQGDNQGNGSNQGSTGETHNTTTTPSNGGSAVNHNNDKGNNSSDNHGGRLPQTGSKKAIVPLTELGLLLIAVAVIAVVYARKRKER